LVGWRSHHPHPTPTTVHGTRDPVWRLGDHTVLVTAGFGFVFPISTRRLPLAQNLSRHCSTCLPNYAYAARAALLRAPGIFNVTYRAILFRALQARHSTRHGLGCRCTFMRVCWRQAYQGRGVPSALVNVVWAGGCGRWHVGAHRYRTSYTSGRPRYPGAARIPSSPSRSAGISPYCAAAFFCTSRLLFPVPRRLRSASFVAVCVVFSPAVERGSLFLAIHLLRIMQALPLHAARGHAPPAAFLHCGSIFVLLHYYIAYSHSLFTAYVQTTITHLFCRATVLRLRTPRHRYAYGVAGEAHTPTSLPHSASTLRSSSVLVTVYLR